MQAANQILYDGKYFRRDIGKDLMGLWFLFGFIVLIF
jgi:hypothetical protein